MNKTQKILSVLNKQKEPISLKELSKITKISIHQDNLIDSILILKDFGKVKINKERMISAV